MKDVFWFYDEDGNEVDRWKVIDPSVTPWHLEDRRLSLAAKGLLTEVIRTDPHELYGSCRESRKEILGIFRELEKVGYVEMRRVIGGYLFKIHPKGKW